MNKRILSILLCLCMGVWILPATAFAAGGGAIQLGAGGITENNRVYFGKYTENGTDYDVPWYVLPSTTLSETNVASGTRTLPLLSEYLLDRNAFCNGASGYYESSALQQRMYNLYNSGIKLFTTAEQSAVADTVLTGNSMYSGQKDLSGQKLFPLSQTEAENLTMGSSILQAKFITAPYDSANLWWLRSSQTEKYAFVVTYTGSGSNYPVVDVHGVRPAFHLDLSKVLFTSAAKGGKASGTVGSGALTAVSSITPTEWKLTLSDSGRGFAVTDRVFTGAKAFVTYSGATVGTNEYISAIVKDGIGNIKYYGRVAKPVAASGTAAINLSGVAMEATDMLYVFSEQCNGDYKTDYASALVEVSLMKNAYAVTNSLTNIKSDNASAYRLMSDATDYPATLSAAIGYTLPAAITVTVGGTALTAGTGYTYNSKSGALHIPAASITGDIEIKAEGTVPTNPFVTPPKTGDPSTPLLWLCLCLLGGAGLLALTLSKKAEDVNGEFYRKRKKNTRRF